MSPSSRSSPASAPRAGPGAIAIAWLLGCVFAAPAVANHLRVEAPPLPPAVIEQARDVHPQGGAEMRFLGLSIYDGWYWGPGHEWSLAVPFVLDLQYHRSLSGTMIADRGVSEIEHLGLATPAQLERWGELMRRIFPDVGDGDRITGLYLPPGIVRYFFNGKPIGEVADPAFARAFFGIWLDPKTSRADYRLKLLGGAQ